MRIPFPRSPRHALPRGQRVPMLVGLVYLVGLIVFFAWFFLTHFERLE